MTTAIEKPQDLFAALEKMRPAIAAALPKHCSPDRIARVVMTALRTVPKLAECTPQSFFGSIMQASQLGLEVCTPLGHAYLVPYRDNKRNCMIAQLIIGYQGMMDLARRSGMVKAIRAHAVYEKDAFDWELGLTPKLYHKPADGDRGAPTHVYAVAKLNDDEPVFTVLTVEQVEQYRARSRASGDGPWVTDPEAMALKTAVRRLYTWLPKSVEMAHATTEDAETTVYSPEVQHVLASLPAEPAPPAQPDPVPDGTPEGQRVPAGSRQRTPRAQPKPKMAPSPEPAQEPKPAPEDAISRPAAWMPSWGELHAELAQADPMWEGDGRLPLVMAFTDAERKTAWEWAYRVNQGWEVKSRPEHTKPPRAPGED